MKPHEEQWGHDQAGLRTPRDGVGYVEVAMESDAHARLASAAPDMARVLLSVEWDGNADEDICPSCYQHEAMGHAADCALDAALHKAGVR
jgi:hypothetical protein